MWLPLCHMLAKAQKQGLKQELMITPPPIPISPLKYPASGANIKRPGMPLNVIYFIFKMAVYLFYTGCRVHKCIFLSVND